VLSEDWFWRSKGRKKKPTGWKHWLPEQDGGGSPGRVSSLTSEASDQPGMVPGTCWIAIAEGGSDLSMNTCSNYCYLHARTEDVRLFLVQFCSASRLLGDLEKEDGPEINRNMLDLAWRSIAGPYEPLVNR